MDAIDRWMPQTGGCYRQAGGCYRQVDAMERWLGKKGSCGGKVAMMETGCDGKIP